MVTSPGAAALGEPFVRQRRDNLYTTKSRSFCQPCNGGWMSMIETAVKQLLPPLIDGASVHLSDADVGALATWAAKTALTAQHTRDAAVIWTQDQRDELRLKARPPVGVEVFLGHHANAEWLMRLQQEHHFAMAPELPGRHLLAQLVTMLSRGHLLLVVHTVSPAWTKSHEDFARYLLTTDRFVEAGLVPIWPGPRGGEWPGTFQMLDEQVVTVKTLLQKATISAQTSAGQPFFLTHQLGQNFGNLPMPPQ